MYTCSFLCQEIVFEKLTKTRSNVFILCLPDGADKYLCDLDSVI